MRTVILTSVTLILTFSAVFGQAPFPEPAWTLRTPLRQIQSVVQTYDQGRYLLESQYRFGRTYYYLWDRQGDSLVAEFRQNLRLPFDDDRLLYVTDTSVDVYSVAPYALSRQFTYEEPAWGWKPDYGYAVLDWFEEEGLALVANTWSRYLLVDLESGELLHTFEIPSSPSIYSSYSGVIDRIDSSVTISWWWTYEDGPDYDSGEGAYRYSGDGWSVRTPVDIQGGTRVQWMSPRYLLIGGDTQYGILDRSSRLLEQGLGLLRLASGSWALAKPSDGVVDVVIFDSLAEQRLIVTVPSSSTVHLYQRRPGELRVATMDSVWICDLGTDEVTSVPSYMEPASGENRAGLVDGHVYLRVLTSENGLYRGRLVESSLEQRDRQLVFRNESTPMYLLDDPAHSGRQVFAASSEVWRVGESDGAVLDRKASFAAAKGQFVRSAGRWVWFDEDDDCTKSVNAFDSTDVVRNPWINEIAVPTHGRSIWVHGGQPLIREIEPGTHSVIRERDLRTEYEYEEIGEMVVLPGDSILAAVIGRNDSVWIVQIDTRTLEIAHLVHVDSFDLVARVSELTYLPREDAFAFVGNSHVRIISDNGAVVSSEKPVVGRKLGATAYGAVVALVGRTIMRVDAMTGAVEELAQIDRDYVDMDILANGTVAAVANLYEYPPLTLVDLEFGSTQKINLRPGHTHLCHDGKHVFVSDALLLHTAVLFDPITGFELESEWPESLPASYSRGLSDRDELIWRITEDHVAVVVQTDDWVMSLSDQGRAVSTPAIEPHPHQQMPLQSNNAVLSSGFYHNVVDPITATQIYRFLPEYTDVRLWFESSDRTWVLVNKDLDGSSIALLRFEAPVGDLDQGRCPQQEPVEAKASFGHIRTKLLSPFTDDVIQMTPEDKLLFQPLADLTRRDTLDLGFAPVYRRELSFNGRSLSVFGNDRVVVIDVPTRKVSMELLLDKAPQSVQWNARGDGLFVATGQDSLTYYHLGGVVSADSVAPKVPNCHLDIQAFVTSDGVRVVGGAWSGSVLVSTVDGRVVAGPVSIEPGSEVLLQLSSLSDQLLMAVGRSGDCVGTVKLRYQP